MAITYYKRFRMEIDLDRAVTAAALPRPFLWVPWEESLLEQHAEVKFRSFLEDVTPPDPIHQRVEAAFRGSLGRDP